jgi:pimeloyl-ACP methyl ester carboxylesterase
MSIKGRTLDIGGLNFNALVDGEGPDVLLIHGFPDSNSVWRHQIPALVEAGYRVIAPDLRGFGDTAMPPKKADYHIDRLVADLIGILDALDVDKVRLAGHDWGSAICWHTCLRHPDRIDRYAALSVGHPSAYAHGGLKQKLKSWYIMFFQLPWLSETLVTARDWWLWRRMMRYDPELPTWKEDLSRPGRLTAALNYYRANLALILPKKWPNATMPVMGVWGEGDVATAERQMVESQKYVDAQWRYERVEAGGHWSMLAAPEKVTALLLDFMTDRARDGGRSVGTDVRSEM